MSIRVNASGQIGEGDQPLILGMEKLTKSAIEALDQEGQRVVDGVRSDLRKDSNEDPNIEAVLTRIRQLAEVIGDFKMHGLGKSGFQELADNICEQIGRHVSVELPSGPNPYLDVVSWIMGTRRDYPIEVFTPNYDLLLEEALERRQAPYFDGFVGSHRPFFDPASVLTDELPPRWTLLWKLHGSLGWEKRGENIVRTGQRNATALIYPQHLKYEQVGRRPYSALFERLRAFLTTPDTLLICTGFSFSDAHIRAVFDEALASNKHTAIFAFQYRCLSGERSAADLAERRSNMSVYGQDSAIIRGVIGRWQPGPPNEERRPMQSMFWQDACDAAGKFLLGDFSKLAYFLKSINTRQIEPVDATDEMDEGPHTKSQGEIRGSIDAES